MKILLISLMFITTSFSCKDSLSNKLSQMDDKGFAVVELFTSEGCSSCPPADRAVEKLLKQYTGNVYVLGYHVDYWDQLGWKDIFSNARYTQRQKTYAKALNLASVYTPQIIVNGTQQFVGSDEAKLNAAVIKSLQQASTIKLTINAKKDSGNEVKVQYATDGAKANLCVALIQLHAENKIQRGENSGTTLHHVNIVRDIKTVAAGSNGAVMLNLPENLSVDDCKVIIFVQNVSDNKIIAATESNIE